MLRAIPSSIEIHAFTDTTVDKNALLKFKDLVDNVLDFAEGLGTVPAELEVSSDGFRCVAIVPTKNNVVS